MKKERNRMIYGSLNRRIVSSHGSHSIKEWVDILGYDLKDLESFSDATAQDIKVIVQKLIDYAYNGSQCTYPFKDKRKPKDLMGMRFTRLTVIGVSKHYGYICKCDCGETRMAKGYKLLCHEIRSCGCLRRENQSVFVRCREHGVVNDCRRLTFKGRNMTITEWSKQPEIIALGIKRRNIYSRLRAGWSIERTLTTKSRRLSS